MTQLQQLQHLRDQLHAKSTPEKMEILSQQPNVQLFTKSNSSVTHWLKSLFPEQQYLLLSAIAAGQGPAIFEGFDPKKITGLDSFLRMLKDLEKMYDTIGGIIGYQLTMLRLIEKRKVKGSIPQGTRYMKPEGVNIEEETPEVQTAIRTGLDHLPELAEIYPVGGAGDRLDLICDIEQEPLPAAQLLFSGRTLLEGLIRDVQAREYLYYKLYKKQITIPIALMTSHEKRNHFRITKILEEKNWFNRGEKNFRLFNQPLVPVVTEEGSWISQRPLHPQLKPGGHGVVWKLAIDQGIFDWFKKLGKLKGLVRQINNPIAGTDYGLLAFTGIGFSGNKDFGFASCPRLPKTAEGTDVLVEQKTEEGYRYTISNIEYVDLAAKGIDDKPESAASPYSQFPSNTNILFFDFDAITKAVVKCPIPGMLINMKTHVKIGNKDCYAGRLESTMQNISDVIAETSPEPLESKKNMRVFITYNKRRKTLSVAKNAYSPDKPLIGTPEGCLNEIMENMHDLLVNHCKMVLPKQDVLILLHPALGPLFSIIAQKIKGGKIETNSDMTLEIAELEMENLQLTGSLHIEADHILGHINTEGVLLYSDHCGKCTLKNVTIQNKGIDRAAENIYWKNQIIRKEVLDIQLKGNAEFFAENVTFKGNYHLVVPDGHKMVAYEQNGKLHFQTTPLEKSWSWNYQFDSDDSRLCKVTKLTRQNQS